MCAETDESRRLSYISRFAGRCEATGKACKSQKSGGATFLIGAQQNAPYNCLIHRNAIAQGVRGLEGEFDALYNAHAAMVYWTAYGVAHSHDAAADLTQTTFLKAYEHWETLAKLAAPQARAWLYKTCRNLAFNRKRRERRLSFPGELPESRYEAAPPSTDEAYEEKELALRLRREVLALPEIYRAPVILHYFAQLSCEEAARALLVPGGTYRARLFRARALLEKALESEAMES